LLRARGRDLGPASIFSDWGEAAPAATTAALRQTLSRRFLVAFDQDQQAEWRPARPGDDPLHIHRLEVANWTGPQLLAELDVGNRRVHSAHS
jgi:hypothetical protein